MKIVLLNAATLPVYRQELAHLLNDAIAQGAALGFPHEVAQQEAEDFFHDLRPAMSTNQLLLWIARDEHGLVGTVQLDLTPAATSQQEGTVSTLLVHAKARRQGVGKLLMRELEKTAFNLRKGVLSLDIEAGTPAEAFYRAQGYSCSGKRPTQYTSSSSHPDREMVYYKRLIPEASMLQQRVS